MKGVLKLVTVYIDVYFLINFVIDFLALYFSSCYSKINVSIKRLILASIFGSLFASLNILVNLSYILSLLLSLFSFVVMVLITTKNVSAYRRIRYGIFLLVFMMLVGGAAYYGFIVFEKLISNADISELNSPNRKLLFLAITILLITGITKLIIIFYEDTRSVKSCYFEIIYENNSEIFEALIDSGNFAVDPFDGTPVVFVSPVIFKKIFRFAIDDVNSLPPKIKKKIRIIPLSGVDGEKIAYAIRPDKALILLKNKKENVKALIACDYNNTSYGGYEALTSNALINGINFE